MTDKKPRRSAQGEPDEKESLAEYEAYLTGIIDKELAAAYESTVYLGLPEQERVGFLKERLAIVAKAEEERLDRIMIADKYEAWAKAQPGAMTDAERSELKALLEAEVEDWLEQRPDFILPWDRELNEDSGQFYITEAEIVVFRLDTAYCPALFVAYSAYEVLVDLVDPSYYPPRLVELVVKARSLCPPAMYGDYSFPLLPIQTPHSDDRQWFMWFAKEFFDIPFRQSSAYYDKRTYNAAAVLVFANEQKDDQAQTIKKEKIKLRQAGRGGEADEFDDDIPF